MFSRERIIAEEYWYIQLSRRYQWVWSKTHWCRATILSMLFFTAGVILNTLAGVYATEKASNSVTDIMLSNIPVFDVDYLFVYGPLALIGFVVLLALWHPKQIPFTLYALGLFWIVRAAFVSLTHIGPFPDHATLDFQSKIILTMFGGGDEFFSGHTGAPFLLALIYWYYKPLRYLFLACSILFGIVVLLGHYHYTIDVASAFFISYGIYQIALWLFPKSRALFMLGEWETTV